MTICPSSTYFQRSQHLVFFFLFLSPKKSDCNIGLVHKGSDTDQVIIVTNTVVTNYNSYKCYRLRTVYFVHAYVNVCTHAHVELICSCAGEQ